MKEKIWIHIPIRYENQLSRWKRSLSYYTEDKMWGKLAAFEFFSDEKKYNELNEFLKANNIDFYIFRREYSFTKSEIENSEILRLIIGGNAKDSEIDVEDKFCSLCNNWLPRIEYNKLFLFENNLRYFDLLITYSGHKEIIISEKLKKIIKNYGLTGAKFLPVYNIEDRNKIIKDYFQLKLTVGIGNIIEPSIFDKGNFCDTCKFYSKFLCQTPLYFQRKTWKGFDMCYTLDWFGSPPQYQSRSIIISNRFYQVLKKNRIKSFSIQPAFFVD